MTRSSISFAGRCPVLREARDLLLAESPWLTEEEHGLRLDLAMYARASCKPPPSVLPPDAAVVVPFWVLGEKVHSRKKNPAPFELPLSTESRRRDIAAADWMRLRSALRPFLKEFLEARMCETWMAMGHGKSARLLERALNLDEPPEIVRNVTVALQTQWLYRLSDASDWTAGFLPTDGRVDHECRNLVLSIDALRQRLFHALIHGRWDLLQRRLEPAALEGRLSQVWPLLWRKPKGVEGIQISSITRGLHSSLEFWKNMIDISISESLKSLQFGFSIFGHRFPKLSSDIKDFLAKYDDELTQNVGDAEWDRWIFSVFLQTPWLLLLVLRVVSVEEDAEGACFYRLGFDQMLREMTASAFGTDFIELHSSDQEETVSRSEGRNLTSAIDLMESEDFGGRVWDELGKHTPRSH